MKNRPVSSSSRRRSMAWPMMAVVGCVVLVVVFLKHKDATSSLYTSSSNLLLLNSTATTTAREDERLIDLQKFDSDNVWNQLLQEAAAKVQRGEEIGIAMEIGMHNLKQCATAAKSGLTTHCFEPSPTSFQRITREYQNLDAVVRNRITLYNNAVGASSGEKLVFSGAGGTGDYVGEGIDIWTMTQQTAAPGASVSTTATDSSNTYVETIRLDDVIRNMQHKKVFVAKIDTQGFEPVVFQGLRESLQHQKLTFILFEYWPKGMDLMNNHHAATADGQCIAADILKLLTKYGYRLIGFRVMAHPKAGRDHKALVETRPVVGFRANCQWYYELERRMNKTDYHMGYWSDFLAVAPNAEEVLGRPASDIGKEILENLLAAKAKA